MADAADVLLEIGTEEIPARFLPSVRRQLVADAERRFTEAFLTRSTTAFAAHATPRRLVLHVTDVAEEAVKPSVAVSGPPLAVAKDAAGKWTPAALGFARKQGVDPAELTVGADAKGKPIVVAQTKPERRPVAAVLPEILGSLIRDLAFPKVMRWPQSEFAFARPIRWLVALHGTALIPLSLKATDGSVAIESAKVTRGRRFKGQDALPVSSPADFFAVLKKAGLLVQTGERRALIRREAEVLAGKAGGRVLWNEDLLGEVGDLVEAPVAVLGSFPRDILAIPAEVVVASMQDHQRYFPVADDAGRLLPHFITIANGVNTPEVVAGNEAVLKARLADAKFFWETDRKKRAEDRLAALAGVVWQARAGSMLDKARRLERLAGVLLDQAVPAAADPEAPGAHRPHAVRAGLLAKTDLVSAMVGEFPELQGVMGGLYGREAGEPPEVAAAVGEHYRPAGPADEIPRTIAGCGVALADKLDHLVGHFALGHAPTGAADPFALRRAAIGVVRILSERGWRLPLRAALQAASEGFRYEERREHGAAKADAKTVAGAGQGVEAAHAFLRVRLEGVFEEQGFAHDEIQAALVDFDDLVLAGARLKALATLRTRAGFKETVVALSRVTNILPKDFRASPVDPAALPAPERALHDAHAGIRPAVARHAAAGEFEAVYASVAGLKSAIDGFFDGVMVNDPNAAVRQRRLSLLAELASTIRVFADVKALTVA